MATGSADMSANVDQLSAGMAHLSVTASDFAAAVAEVGVLIGSASVHSLPASKLEQPTPEANDPLLLCHSAAVHFVVTAGSLSSVDDRAASSWEVSEQPALNDSHKQLLCCYASDLVAGDVAAHIASPDPLQLPAASDKASPGVHSRAQLEAQHVTSSGAVEYDPGGAPFAATEGVSACSEETCIHRANRVSTPTSAVPHQCPPDCSYAFYAASNSTSSSGAHSPAARLSCGCSPASSVSGTAGSDSSWLVAAASEAAAAEAEATSDWTLATATEMAFAAATAASATAAAGTATMAVDMATEPLAAAPSAVETSVAAADVGMTVPVAKPVAGRPSTMKVESAADTAAATVGVAAMAAGAASAAAVSNTPADSQLPLIAADLQFPCRPLPEPDASVAENYQPVAFGFGNLQNGKSDSVAALDATESPAAVGDISGPKPCGYDGAPAETRAPGCLQLSSVEPVVECEALRGEPSCLALAVAGCIVRSGPDPAASAAADCRSQTSCRPIPGLERDVPFATAGELELRPTQFEDDDDGGDYVMLRQQSGGQHTGGSRREIPVLPCVPLPSAVVESGSMSTRQCDGGSSTADQVVGTSPAHGQDTEDGVDEVDDNDDDDNGIYDESYRSSRWLFVGRDTDEEDNQVTGAHESETSRPTHDTAHYIDAAHCAAAAAAAVVHAPLQHSELELAASGQRDAAAQPPPADSSSTDESSAAGGKVWTEAAAGALDERSSDSSSSLATASQGPGPAATAPAAGAQSEADRRGVYRSISCKTVQRHSSLEVFHRETTRIIEPDKTVILTRRSPSDDYGFHIKGSHPIVVTLVRPGSLADDSGIKIGDVLLAVNYHSVLSLTHEQTLQLITSDRLTLVLELCSKLEGLVTGSVPLLLYSQPEVSPAAMTVHAGYLSKVTGLLRLWKRFWFVLKPDNCLYYYRTETDKDPLGAIPLSGYTLSRATDVKKDCTLKLMNSSSSYYLAGESESDITQWAELLNQACSTKSSASDTWLETSAHNVSLPALAIKSPDCHGQLTKMGGRLKTWRRRYCVLKDGCLYYYINISSTSAQGVAHLHGYTVDPLPSSSKKNAFNLVPPSPRMRTFCFFADTDFEKDRWVRAMTLSIGRWARLDSRSIRKSSTASLKDSFSVAGEPTTVQELPNQQQQGFSDEQWMLVESKH